MNHLKPMRLLIATAALLLCAAVADVIVGTGNGRAITISNPGSTTVEGVATCAGPPSTGDFLFYNGTQWCDGVANNTAINLKNAAGTNVNAIQVDVSNNLILASGLASITAGNNAPLRLGTGGIVFQYGSDITEANGPRTVCGWNVNQALDTGPTVVSGSCELDVAAHIKRAWVNALVPVAGCTTSPIYTLRVNGANTATTFTMTNGTNIIRATGLTIAVPATQVIDVALTTTGAGCTTHGTQANWNVELTVD